MGGWGGANVFRAAQGVQTRIEALLQKQPDADLTPSEHAELDRYEAIDDYLSFVNRTIPNWNMAIAPLKLNAIGRAGEGDDIADVAHAGHKLHQALKAEAKTGVGHGAKAAQV